MIQDFTGKYPVIYLLHGLFGTHVDRATTGHMKDVVDELIASGELRKVIIIMPDAGDSDIHNNWHSWEYWHTALRLSLPFASRNFEP
ncbi:MAG: hypothetical protein IKR69_06600 [Bacteroidales bacterium]|nr:hypothetical protein [Bacteroidales bacterium]